jgi:hypothetical protein
MDIQISVQNPQKAIALLEFLKSFEMIDKFKILGNSFSKVQTEKKEVSSFEKFYGSSKTEQDEPSLFDQIYGSVPELDITKFETYLTETRNEWERPLY